ncbi:hypothetical protein KR96_24785 [Ralstonia solanacearum]|nr:hypothetical protein KR96_24785 [Ralstonia solanacearum]KFX81300.1 hypothetical protein KR99_24225 [Ralstonia solanacearum]
MDMHSGPGTKPKQAANYFRRRRTQLACWWMPSQGLTQETVAVGMHATPMFRPQRKRATDSISAAVMLSACGTHTLSLGPAHLGGTEQLRKTIFEHLERTASDI